MTTPLGVTAARWGSVTFSAIERSISSPWSLRPSGSIAMPARIAPRGERMRTGRPSTSIVAASRPVGAEDRPRDLGAAAADEAGEPDDLAGANVERDVVDRRARA